MMVLETLVTDNNRFHETRSDAKVKCETESTREARTIIKVVIT